MNDMTRLGPYLHELQRLPGETAVTIRPVHPRDVQPILDMHQRLSSNTLFLRYLVPYLPAQLPKHLQHICSRADTQSTGLAACCGSQIVGFGYYVIKPAQPDTAELALLIEDRFQGQGIGSNLLDRLISSARAQGVRFFDALTHSSNRQMHHLLDRTGRLISSCPESGQIVSVLALENE